MTEDEAAQLQRRFAVWTEAEPSWRALAVVGSWARDAAREDSDLDLLALTSQLARWTADDRWLRDLVGRLGFQVASSNVEVYGVARSWRIWLGAGLEVEITLVDLDWATVRPLDNGTRRVVSDGMRPLVDKDGLLRAIGAAVEFTPSPAAPPTRP